MKLIRYKPKKVSGNWDKAVEIWDANRKQLNMIDTQSQMAGELLGRYIEEPYADGFAIYQITGVLKNKVRIELVTDIGDDWEIPYWGDDTLIDKSYAEDHVAWRDARDRMVNKMREERSKKAIVEDVIAKAVAQ